MEESYAVCFSGHRPEKLPDGGDMSSPAVRAVISIIYSEIEKRIADGANIFITGMSRGVDLWAGEIAAEMKCSGRPIKLVAAMPYRGFTDSFTGREKWAAGFIMSNADTVYHISEEYEKDCMKKRNQFMVDHSSALIAVCKDSRSGTGQTIRMAQKKGIDVKIIDLAPFFALSGLSEDELPAQYRSAPHFRF